MDQDLNKVQTLQLTDMFKKFYFNLYVPLDLIFYLDIYFLKKSGHCLLVKSKAYWSSAMPVPKRRHLRFL